MKIGPYKAIILFSLMMGPLVFLLPHNVLAWGGGGGEGEEGGYGPSGCGYGCGGCGGYCAGQQDAQYDLQNNLQYQPYGNCLPCHSQGYWDNFHQGYDSYWNNHQSQEQSQGASINIYGNNNYASIGQSAQQNPLQELGHALCGIVNCNGLAAGGLQGGQPNQNVPYNPY